MKTIYYTVYNSKMFDDIVENIILKNIFVNFTGFYKKQQIYINLRENKGDKPMFLIIVSVNMTKTAYSLCLRKVKKIANGGIGF